MKKARQRLERERDAAIGRLREPGISPHLDEEDAPHAGTDTVRSAARTPPRPPPPPGPVRALWPPRAGPRPAI